MNTKEKLIDKISSIEDPGILEEIDRWITSLIEEASAKKYSRQELDAVREGYEQYTSGNTVTHEEANEMFNQWLKGK